ncbi:hypothetical protein ACOSZG_08310 [Vibrio alginolyticus]|uniref:hypothetical protein n=1 Tax=Vibrio alginolyticus TaxID=663 RepID=UPI003BA301F9
MVEHATSFTGLNVEHKTFQQVDVREKYDAIWTCASLLHVPKDELLEVFIKLTEALKTGGIWYLSFKYGSQERIKDGRNFTDMDESSIQSLLSQIPALLSVKTWITTDARPELEERWLNVIIQESIKAGCSN